MPACFFATDLHGSPARYSALWRLAASERPAAMFLGGDLLPTGLAAWTSLRLSPRDFINNVLAAGFARLRESLGQDYPRVFLILGNDDARAEEAGILEAADHGLWEYAHMRRVEFGEWTVYGYACVPPTPFLLKDWERYDVSRYVDPGCISPEEGSRSVPVAPDEVRYGTIQDDLAHLTGADDLSRAIVLCHSPPYETNLDRAALDGKCVEHVPLDVHVGSIALRRFIETRQPLLTLHGHVHESTRLTGEWREHLGRTVMLQGAHDGPELALVRFDPADPAAATRATI